MLLVRLVATTVSTLSCGCLVVCPSHRAQLFQADIEWQERQGPRLVQPTAAGGIVMVYPVVNKFDANVRVCVLRGLALRLAWMRGVVRHAQAGVPVVRAKR